MAVDTGQLAQFTIVQIPESIQTPMHPGHPVTMLGAVAFGTEQDNVSLRYLTSVVIYKGISVFRMVAVHAKPVVSVVQCASPVLHQLVR